MITQDLGIATAYGYAKSKGYTGTEAEFAELMASYASTAQTAIEAADRAVEANTAAQSAKTSAQSSASTASTAAQTATSKASEAVTAAGTATTKASEASQSASTASAAATSASTSAQTATTAADTATAKASEASESATTATTAKTDAESARDAAAQSASAAAESARTLTIDATLTQSGQAADAKVVGDEISDLKEDLIKFGPVFSVSLPWVGVGYIKSDGTIQGYTNFSYTDYIYVGGGDAHLSGNLYYVPANHYYVGCYDGDYNFLGGLFQGTGQQLICDDDLTLPSGTVYIRICDYTPQRDSLELYIYNNISDIATQSQNNAASIVNIVNRTNAEDIANNLFAYLAYTEDWAIETDSSLNVYVKGYPYLLVRGGWTSPDSYTIPWSDVVTSLSSYIATSPSGIVNCIKLPHNYSLCLDINNKNLVVRSVSSQKYPSYIELVTNMNGMIIRGQIKDWINWKNYKDIAVLESKLSDTAYIPSDIKTGLIDINKEATYTYQDLPKILWISDVHWNNDCYAYLKYLVDFGQYDALIISGDLNYYQFEQTLTDTETGMSELARIWNNYYNGKTVLLPCRGNHDGHVGYYDYTSEMFASAVIKPFHDCESNGYYYYDLEEYQIRVIMLNSCDDAQGRKGFTSEQVTWFENTLASVPSGWSVISVSHHPIVSAINTESSLAGNSAGIVSAIQNFITNHPANDYIAHLSGHTHADMMEKVDGVEYVSIVDSSTDQSDYSADVICINQTTKTVNLLRSGEGADRAFMY